LVSAILQLMFPNLNIYFILGPAIIAVVIAALVMRLRVRRQPTELSKAIAVLKFNVLCVGMFLVLLWFLLPITAVLSTFGYPASVNDIQRPDRVLKYLQDYNKALVRTTTVLYWFIFVFVWWFLATVYSLSKTLGKLADAQPIHFVQSN
jgi:hypothetical protein